MNRPSRPETVPAPEGIAPTRLEFFSDGVIAIAITLLVLEFKPPHLDAPRSAAEAERALAGLWPELVSYLLSFFFLAVFWVNHHRLFHRLGRVDDGLTWWNIALLLTLSFIPFPTSLIGEYPRNPVPILLFSGIFMLAGIVFNLMWRHAQARSLFHSRVSPATVRHVVRWGLLGPGLYLLAGLAALIAPVAAWVLLVLIPFLFVIPIRGD